MTLVDDKGTSKIHLDLALSSIVFYIGFGN